LTKEEKAQMGKNIIKLFTNIQPKLKPQFTRKVIDRKIAQGLL
jgi:hypothetical protein